MFTDRTTVRPDHCLLDFVRGHPFPGTIDNIPGAFKNIRGRLADKSVLCQAAYLEGGKTSRIDITRSWQYRRVSSDEVSWPYVLVYQNGEFFGGFRVLGREQYSWEVHLWRPQGQVHFDIRESLTCDRRKLWQAVDAYIRGRVLRENLLNYRLSS